MQDKYGRINRGFNKLKLNGPKGEDPGRHLRDIAIEAFKKGLFAVDPERLIDDAVDIRQEENKVIFRACELKYGKFLEHPGYNVSIGYDLKDFVKNGEILIIGGGKAAAPMAHAILKKFSSIVRCKGIINIPHGQDWGHEIVYNIDKEQGPEQGQDRGENRNNDREDDTTSTVVATYKKSGIIVNYAAHPVPDNSGLEGVRKMVQMIKQAKKDTPVIILISGGGSALMPFPRPPLALDDLQKVNELLLKSGADINEINCIRKHLSGFKGGNLIKMTYPRPTIALIISDVINDPMDVIASGPTVPDTTTFDDARRILEKYDLMDKVPAIVKSLILRATMGNRGVDTRGIDAKEVNGKGVNGKGINGKGINGKGINGKGINGKGINGKVPDNINQKNIFNNYPESLEENPKPDDPIFESVHNLIIGSAELAKDAMINYLHDHNFIEPDKLIAPNMKGEYNSILENISKERTNALKDFLNNILKGNGRKISAGQNGEDIVLKYDVVLEDNFRLKLRTLRGEASAFGRSLADLMAYIMLSYNNSKSSNKTIGLFLISSGEFTVTIKGNGKGGRNQEMLLAFLHQLFRSVQDIGTLPEFCIGSMAFDGIEGNSPAAGALIDNAVLETIQAQKLDSKIIEYLNNNDSYSFFERIKSAIVIGQTQTNINDIMLILLKI